jgi:hypothetical protein
LEAENEDRALRRSSVPAAVVDEVARAWPIFVVVDEDVCSDRCDLAGCETDCRHRRFLM